jgi:hypothetical protein
MAMPNILKMIRDFMEKEGIPGRDAYDLPTSQKTFPDGANYRIEIAGVERASTMEALNHIQILSLWRVLQCGRRPGG